MGALLSFLGGSVFRMIWGEVSAFVNKRQDHTHELEMLRLQSELEDKAHARQLESIERQAALGIKTIEAQAVAAVDAEEAQAFTAAMQNAFKPTGIVWVDAWNGVIRPAAATLALALWFEALWFASFKLSDFDRDLMGVILGFFFASRVLAARGK